MKFLDQIKEYLFLKKPDPNEHRSKFVKYMHGMNRISIYMFIIALLIILFRVLFR